MSTDQILQNLKGHLPSYLSFVGTVTLAGMMAFGNYRAQDTHSQDQIQQLQAEVADLKRQVASDMATRAELSEFKTDTKSRMQRIEDKLDQELQFHRIGPRR